VYGILAGVYRAGNIIVYWLSKSKEPFTKKLPIKYGGEYHTNCCVHAEVTGYKANSIETGFTF